MRTFNMNRRKNNIVIWLLIISSCIHDIISQKNKQLRTYTNNCIAYDISFAIAKLSFSLSYQSSKSEAQHAKIKHSCHLRETSDQNNTRVNA